MMRGEQGAGEATTIQNVMLNVHVESVSTFREQFRVKERISCEVYRQGMENLIIL